MTRRAMLRSAIQLSGLLMAGLSMGCAFVGPPVNVSGPSRQVALLEGSWWGEYTGDANHLRHGSISFTLAPDTHQAQGSVLMTAEGLPRPYERVHGDAGQRPRGENRPETSLLSIRFVFVDEGVVVGDLDPYWDPDRATRALTTFRGTIDGRTISGTFRTRYANGTESTAGRWKVTKG